MFDPTKKKEKRTRILGCRVCESVYSVLEMVSRRQGTTPTTVATEIINDAIPATKRKLGAE